MPDNEKMRGRAGHSQGVIRERVGRLNATELPTVMLYRNDALLPESIKDVLPDKGEKFAFPFIDAWAHETDESGGIRFVVRDGHGRSAYLGECNLTDEFGNQFIYMDAKGIGASTFLDFTYKMAGQKIKKKFLGLQWVRTRSIQDPHGILSHALAKNDLRYSELFAKVGIGGHRVVTMFEYTKLPVPDPQGNPQSILRTTKTLQNKKEDEPMGLPDRAVGVIRVFSEVRLNAVKQGELRPILERLNKRYSLKLNSGMDYVLWLARRLGRNLAIMHKLGCTHKYLSAHNVLADGSFTDDDSVTGPEDYGCTRAEMNDNSQLEDETLVPRTFKKRKRNDYSQLTYQLMRLSHDLAPKDVVTQQLVQKMFKLAYKVELTNSRLSTHD